MEEVRWTPPVYRSHSSRSANALLPLNSFLQAISYAFHRHFLTPRTLHQKPPRNKFPTSRGKFRDRVWRPG
ncbi:hypothetical protein PSEEN4654 [Pseudomonas entomophila L48]|uniref:Uncharacterized protein n=1 Tax=Pseudomonas entomophila (strain L48) TaxID=384676 RepID=Q1I4W1_PSEE4|nr:hypothetical protein PSEEN4654 [Pseudomonas entomophila L48]